MLPHIHVHRCRCVIHEADATSPPINLPLMSSKFGDLLRLLIEFAATKQTKDLKDIGITTPVQLAAASMDEVRHIGLPPWLLYRAGLLADEPLPELDGVPAGKRPREDHGQARPDHPLVILDAKGNIEAALAVTWTQESRLAALEALDRDVYSFSGQATQDSHWRTWSRVAKAWGLRPIPLTINTVKCCMASFKAGTYKSVAQYLSKARQMHILTFGMPVPADAQLAMTMYTRSALRGLGPPELKDHWDVYALAAIDASWVHTNPSLCIAPYEMTILACWFLMREIEISAMKACHMEVNCSTKTVAMFLPASKTDTEARGVRRTHGCGCVSLEGRITIVSRRLCPFHLALDLLEVLEEAFGKEYTAGATNPLFPTKEMRTMTKEASIESMRVVVAAAGIPLTRTIAGGRKTQRFNGHGPRVSGAIFLARRGIQVITIQGLGRWGTDSVLRYVQLAPLDELPHIAKQALSYSTQTLHRDFEGLKDRADRWEVLQKKLVTDMGMAEEEAENYLMTLNLLEAEAAKPKEKKDAEPQTLIINTKTNCVHRVLVFDDDDAEQWRTFCGWKFGDASFRMIDPEHKEINEVCRKCAKTYLRTRSTEAWLGIVSSASSDHGEGEAFVE